MAFINVFVSKEAKIYVKNNQLCLENGGNKTDFPLEDVNSVMIENLNTVISTYTLSAFAENGILCFICNQNHLPNGVVLPFFNHYQTLLQYNSQKELPKPLQKQLWKSIIENKIKNQDYVLGTIEKKGLLKPLYETVLSGDSTNNEAKASLIYFKEVFGEDFLRRDESNEVNAFLNYGYSIVRSFIARSIASHGLMPFLGVFHHNQYNQFNLADDLIEPFRPIVDLYVVNNNSKQLTSKEKAKLLNLINYNVIVDGQRQALSYAIEIYVQSYAKSIKEGKNLLKEIVLTELEVHNYE